MKASMRVIYKNRLITAINCNWPGEIRQKVYYDPRSLEIDNPSGVLHAKAVVSDDEAVFVTSTNLTEAALDRNI